MARYASFQLAAWPPRDDADDGPLRRSSVREAQAMSTWTGLEVFPRDVGKPQRANATGYGYGWETQETCEWDRAVFHPGGRPDGYYSMVFLLPESGVGIVLLINFMDTEGVAGQAVRDAARILRAADALEKRELRPSKAQLAVRDAVLSLATPLGPRGSPERTFGPADYLFKLEAVFAIKHRLHGACQMGTPTAVDRLNLRWTAKCESATRDVLHDAGVGRRSPRGHLGAQHALARREARGRRAEAGGARRPVGRQGVRRHHGAGDRPAHRSRWSSPKPGPP